MDDNKYGLTLKSDKKLTISARVSKRHWAQKTRLEIAEYVNSRKSSPCTDCKKTYPFYVMQFDHVRGKKKFSVSQAWRLGYNIENIKAELRKCELVCANCHAERTHKRRVKNRNDKERRKKPKL